jgi:parallel beta-helix repeat protein
MLVLLVISVLALAYRTQPARSSPATITVPDDYPTIQAAINAAADGDTVFVKNGTYYEHVTINKSITLVGEDSNTTIIDGNGTGPIIEIAADYVTISNFTIRNAGTTLEEYLSESALACIASDFTPLQSVNVENNVLLNASWGILFGWVSSVNISNNIISNIVMYAIDLGASTDMQNRNVTISNNLIYDCETFGINIDGDSQYCSVVNNTVENGLCGIDLGSNFGTGIVPSNNLVEGNNLSNNTGMNLLIESMQGSSQDDYTNTFRMNNLTNTQYHNLVIWGYNLGTFMQDIDSSNTINNNRIYYLTNTVSVDVDSTNCPDAAYVALVNCTNVTAEDFDFSGNNDGLLLAGSSNCTLANMTLANNQLPVLFLNFSGSEAYPNNYGGLNLFESYNNTIVNCNFYNNSYGVGLYRSDGNLFYHNNFVSNDRNVVSNYDNPFSNVSSGYFSPNFWDDGYPVGGNYWSDYNGTDVKSGPYQNETGSDWIGDFPYVIDENNIDRYPLMSPFSAETGPIEVAYRGLLVEFNDLQSNLTSVNSTVSGLQQQLTTLQQSISSLGLSLEDQINSLNQTSTGLGQSLINLRTQISFVNSTLQALINGLQEQNNRLNDRLSIILNVLYVSVALTMIAVISAIYFAVKRQKAKPKS